MTLTRLRPMFVLVVGLILVGLLPASVQAADETDTWLDSDRVSVASDGTEGNGDSQDPMLSHDGSVVVFTSWASNLVTGDTNDAQDIFHHDRASGVTSRVSVASDGSEASGESSVDDLSSDGRFVLFTSDSSNLVANDTNGVRDVFRWDLATGETNRVSLADDGSELNDASWGGSITEDGNLVAFVSAATNVGVPALELSFDLYVRDLAAASTHRADQVPAEGLFLEYGISRDGFISGDGKVALVIRWVEVDLGFHDPSGHVLDLSTGEELGVVGLCYAPILAADGSVVACNVNHEFDRSFTWYYDIPTGQLTTFGNDSGPENSAYSLSADGDVVGISASGVPAAAYDRSRRTVTSVAGNGLVQARRSSGPIVSGDGLVAAYSTDAPYLVGGDTNGHEDVFVTTWSSITIGDAFGDDVASVFEGEINWLAAARIGKGCNPPANDAFCPEESLTRGQMAALLVRALNLSDDGDDPFVDDDGSVFEADINKLAAAGITKGCNPPFNDRFCPDDSLARGEFAALIARAINLSEYAIDTFIDDDDSIFEPDIQALAGSDITKGCNPPVNDRFCPDDPVTRAQAAAFFKRAFAKPVLLDSAIP